MSESAKIKVFTKEHRKNIGDSIRGIKNGNYGKPVIGDHRKKLSEAHKRENLSPETRVRMSLGQQNKKRSAEYKQRISFSVSGKRNPRYGIVLSKITRERISLALKRSVCGKGHSMKDSSNVYIKPNGRRRCRECSRIYDRKAYKMGDQ